MKIKLSHLIISAGVLLITLGCVVFTKAQSTTILPVDLNSDKQVNAEDLNLFRNNWGSTIGSPADFNQDGIVDTKDLAIMMSEFNKEIIPEHCKDGIYNEGEQGLDCGWTCPNDCNFVEKSGVLQQNEIWNGNILITEAGVIVPEGITLTIEPGTVVKFKHSRDYKNPGRGWLFIDGGNIEAIGTPESMIWFTSDALDPINGDWWGITIRNSENIIIKYSIIEYAELNLGLNPFVTGLVTNSIIRWSNSEGIYMERSTALIENNTIYGNAYGGIAMEQFNYNVRIRNNKIVGGHTGVHGEATEAILENNIISNNSQWGFSFDDGSSAQLIGNLVINNRWNHLIVNTDGELISNIISNNLNGIDCYDCALIAEDNSIYGNGDYDISIFDGRDINVSNNWWDTTDENAIENRILSEIPINFKPFLTENPNEPIVLNFDYNDIKNFELDYIPGDPGDRYPYIYPNEDETRRVVRKIGEGLGFGWSLVWADGYLWKPSNAGGNILAKLDPENGNILREFEVEGLQQPHGIAYDGSHFWINDFTGLKVFEVDPNTEEIVSTFDLPNEIEGSATSIVWDGEFLYLMSNYPVEGRLIKIDREGNYLGTLDTGRGGGSALTWDGNHFWVVGCKGLGGLCKLSKEGELLGEIYAAAKDPWALAWEPADNQYGGYLWTLHRTCETWNDPKIYQIEILDDSLNPAGCFLNNSIECNSYQINDDSFVINIKNTGPSLIINQITQYFIGEVGGDGPDCPVLSNLDLQINQNEQVEITIPCQVLNNYVGETVEMWIQIIGNQNGEEKIIEGKVVGVVE